MTSRSYGPTRRGLTSWLVQRVTSVYLAGFTLFLLLRFSISPVADFAAWRVWWSGTVVRIALALFVTSVLLHAWLGLRSVYMDYLHSWVLRFMVSTLSALILTLLALWAARLVLTVL